MGVDDAPPALVVGDVGRDDHVGGLGQRAGPTGEHRATAPRPTRSGAGDDLQPHRLGVALRVPATPRHLDQHAWPVVRPGSGSAGPHGRVPGCADHEPRRRPVVGAQGRLAARAQEREHPTVRDQHVGLEVGHAAGRGGLAERIQQEGPQPPALVRGDGDAQLPVAIRQKLVARLPHEPPRRSRGRAHARSPAVRRVAAVVHGGDDAVPTAVGDGREPLDERARWPEAGEEAAVAVLVRQPVVERQQPVGVRGCDGAHGQQRAVGEAHLPSPELVGPSFHRWHRGPCGPSEPGSKVTERATAEADSGRSALCPVAGRWFDQPWRSLDHRGGRP